jgi:lysine-specific demethylase 8
VFAKDYLLPGLPVIISGAIDHWPALEPVGQRRWDNLNYLRSVAGVRTVPVETGPHYLADGWAQTTMSVSDFIDTHLCPGASYCDTADAKLNMMGDPNQDTATTAAASPVVGYLAQHALFDQVPRLKDDIEEPVYCCLPSQPQLDLGQTTTAADAAKAEPDNSTLSEPIVQAWFGPKGTVSPLHQDRYTNLLCQVTGAKYVQLVPADPALTPALFTAPGNMSNTSTVDVEHPDPDAHAEFIEKVRPLASEGVLRAGEMLFIPVKTWHYIKAVEGPSMSVSFWW